MRHFSHLNTATEIINKYKGQQPFHLFIKDFFRQDKKYGSKDRRQITHLCYCYFRLGPFGKNKPLQQVISQALFLCADQPGDMLAAIDPAWNEKAAATVEEKCTILNIDPASFHIFPLPDALSNTIDAPAFNFSHLIQPDVFMRIRPGHQQTVIDKLKLANIVFQLLHTNCIRLPASTKIDELLQVNKEVMIQDYSSQQTGELLNEIHSGQANFSVWDCCAASGGKSIMAKDILGNIDLTVSDIRPAILLNLKKRFSEAGIKNYKVLEADLTKNTTHLPSNSFDLIIADVPCTGSGTWGRTPERLSLFNKKEIETYRGLQQKIVTAAMPALKNGGYFLYITCSVFKKENEDMVDFILQNPTLELIKMNVLKGYRMKADSMFAALFRSI